MIFGYDNNKGLFQLGDSVILFTDTPGRGDGPSNMQDCVSISTVSQLRRDTAISL